MNRQHLDDSALFLKNALAMVQDAIYMADTVTRGETGTSTRAALVLCIAAEARLRRALEDNPQENPEPCLPPSPSSP